MSTGEVISFGTRRPVEDESIEIEAQAERDREMEEVTYEGHKSILFETLVGLAERVSKEEVSGVVVIARDTSGQKFLTEVSVDTKKASRGEIFEWIGILETLKLELMDLAQMAPVLLPNGDTLDPGLISNTDINVEGYFDD